MNLRASRAKRALLLSTCVAAVLSFFPAAPASASCVTAGAYVQVGTQRRTILPDGTCVVTTPYTGNDAGSSDTVTVSQFSVHYSVTVPVPPF